VRVVIIVVVGRPASGKTTVLEMIEKMGFSIASTGDVIRDEIRRRGLRYNKDTDAEIAEWFHKSGREKIIIKRLLDKIDGKKMAFGGLRDPLQLKELKKRTGEDPIIIAVKADFKERLKRIMKRGRFPKENEDYLKSRDEREARHGELKLIKMADYTIDNTNLSLKELREKVRDIIEKIIKKNEHSI